MITTFRQFISKVVFSIDFFRIIVYNNITNRDVGNKITYIDET